MTLPPEFVQAIIAAVERRMPAGFRIVHNGSKVLRFYAPGVGAGIANKPPWWGQVGVRNRDGVTSQSLAWAVWLVLDDLVHMSRSTGCPWPKEVSQQLEAFAESRNGQIYGWVTNGRGYRIDFDPIDSDNVPRIEPGVRGIVNKVTLRRRLPSAGPITRGM